MVATFAPTQWRLDHGQILLLSAGGETWPFEADDNAQWRRVPDSADPLIMIRGRRCRAGWGPAKFARLPTPATAREVGILLDGPRRSERPGESAATTC